MFMWHGQQLVCRYTIRDFPFQSVFTVPHANSTGKHCERDLGLTRKCGRASLLAMSVATSE